MCACNLRPHHALCARFFTGHGYSPEFTRNMTRVLSSLSGNSAVRLCAGADEICAACPNLQNGVCADSDKVTRYDSAVLRLCGLDSGQSVNCAELRRLIDERIILAVRMSEVCPDCEWRAICCEAADVMRRKRDHL